MSDAVYVQPNNAIISNEVIAGTFNVALLAQQIIAAGLSNAVRGFGPAAVELDPALDSGLHAKVVALLAAHDPNAVPGAPVQMPDLSDRQFAAGLWSDGIISYSDFLGFIGPGTIPAPIQAIVNTLPDDTTGAPTPRKNAVGFLTGSKLYQFGHPLVDVFRQAMAASDAKWTPDFLRKQWLAWATL